MNEKNKTVTGLRREDDGLACNKYKRNPRNVFYAFVCVKHYRTYRSEQICAQLDAAWKMKIKNRI